MMISSSTSYNEENLQEQDRWQRIFDYRDRMNSFYSRKRTSSVKEIDEEQTEVSSSSSICFHEANKDLYASAILREGTVVDIYL